jgi:3-hydroxyacyl-CoA dehydrogenase
LDIKKVGVIGAGAMGLGIAQVCAQAGLREYIKELEKQKRGEQAKSDISLSHIR